MVDAVFGRRLTNILNIFILLILNVVYCNVQKPPWVFLGIKTKYFDACVSITIPTSMYVTIHTYNTIQHIQCMIEYGNINLGMIIYKLINFLQY